MRSTLHSVDDAPRQGEEGAPDAWLEVNAELGRALLGVAVGDELWVITWLHRPIATCSRCIRATTRELR